MRLQKASFEQEKTLEGFDFSWAPKINPKRVRDLFTGLFIEKAEHVLLYGPAGVGKTHLAQALGHQACRKGHDVLFVKAVKLFRHLCWPPAPIIPGRNGLSGICIRIC